MKSMPVFAFLFALSLTVSQSSRAENENAIEQIKIAEGQIVYEIVGQVINFTPTTSTQFGYYSYIKDLNTLFAKAPQNETNAFFTFYRETTNLQVRADGPFRIISRDGLTTMYLNSAPSGDFSKPDAFRSGAPIQTSVLRQQVIVDTATATFTVVNQDTITSTTVFLVNGTMHQIGRVGDVFRTVKNGHLNSPGSLPTGWFAGYSVGAEKSHPHLSPDRAQD